MPLKIDVIVNDQLIERVHIARINESGGTAADAVNDYGVIRGAKGLVHSDEPPFDRREFKQEPEWTDWLEPDGQFQHRYGDGPIVCALKALGRLTSELEAELALRDSAHLAAENIELRKRVVELETAINAPPF